MRRWFIVPPIVLLTVALAIGIAAAAASPGPPDVCPCVGGGGEVTAEHEMVLSDLSAEDVSAGDETGFFYFPPILSGTVPEDTLNPADNLPFN